MNPHCILCVPALAGSQSTVHLPIGRFTTSKKWGLWPIPRLRFVRWGAKQKNPCATATEWNARRVPDVLGDDLVGAIAEVEVNEIGEAGHRSQAKSRTRQSLVGKEEDAMRCVAQGMSPKLRDARGIYTAKLAAVGGRSTEAGQGVYHLKLEIKCGLFSRSLNNLCQQFKKRYCPPFISLFFRPLVQLCKSSSQLGRRLKFSFFSGRTNSRSDHLTRPKW